MRYPGGKGKCYQRLINLMPPHRVYIESHLGGGAVLRHKRPAETSIGIDLDERVIAMWSQEPQGGLTVHQGDAIEFLRQYEFKGDELVYADPPYLASTRKRARVYRHDSTESEHEVLLRLLRRLPAMIMVSGYPSALYDDLLQDWTRVVFPAKTHSGVRNECVWLNFSRPLHLHDERYLGDNFRARQNLRRKGQNLVAKFRAMPTQERGALLTVLRDAFPEEWRP